MFSRAPEEFALCDSESTLVSSRILAGSASEPAECETSFANIVFRDIVSFNAELKEFANMFVYHQIADRRIPAATAVFCSGTRAEFRFIAPLSCSGTRAEF